MEDCKRRTLKYVILDIFQKNPGTILSIDEIIEQVGDNELFAYKSQGVVHVPYCVSLKKRRVYAVISYWREKGVKIRDANGNKQASYYLQE